MKVSSFFKPLSFLPALMLMYMIYSFSAQTGDVSSSVSYKVSEKIVSGYNTITRQGWDEWQIQQQAEKIHYYVRKTGHMTEYFLLAVAVSFPLYVYGVRGILLTLLAGLICVAYAFGDEYHQTYVAGRTGTPRDVAIDSIGILIGILLVRILGWSARVSVTGPRIEKRQRIRERELDERERELELREMQLKKRERGERNRFRDRSFREERTAGSGRKERIAEGGENPGWKGREEDIGRQGMSIDTSGEYERKYGKDSGKEYGGNYQPGRYTADRSGRYTAENHSADPYREDSAGPDPYGDSHDEDSADELSEDMTLFRRRKHGRGEL